MGTAGYSGTPLAKKLGIADGARVVPLHAPADYAELVAPFPPGAVVGRKVARTTDLVHLFVLRRADLESELKALRAAIRPDAVVWVSWPKKAAKVPTDITEGVVRSACLPLGFVDVKVCAVNEVWSGLKLVIRKALR